MLTSFNDRLSTLIQQKVTQALADALEGLIDAKAPKGRSNAAETETDAAPDVDTDGTRKRAKRGRGRATRVYALVPVKKGHRRVAPKLHRTAQMVWEFLKENGPSTAQDIEQGTELGKKTVESSVWFLRNSGHVVSKPIDPQ